MDTARLILGERWSTVSGLDNSPSAVIVASLAILGHVNDRRARQRSDDLPWVETIATVVASDYNHSTYGEEDKARSQNLSFFITKFSYRVSGVVYHGQLRSPDVRILGSRFSIRYDPSNPQYNSVMVSDKPVGGKLLPWALVLAGAVALFLVLRFLI